MHLGGSLRKGCDEDFIVPELTFGYKVFPQLKGPICYCSRRYFAVADVSTSSLAPVISATAK